MLDFHPLKVISADRIAEDAVCIELAVPPSLRDRYAFDAGQYLTVRRAIAGREERRTYSIAAAPGDGRLKLGVRLQPQGRMSGELANAVRAGDVLDIGTPMGRFRTEIDPARARTYAAFAAGSGITPVLALAADILAREKSSRFTLIYGNRSTARTMFLEETLALKDRYLGRFAVYFVMSREPQQSELLNGRIDGAKVRELARQIGALATADEYFLCGPGGMVDELRGVIKELNGTAKVRFERFAPADAGSLEVPAEAPPAAPVRAPLATISITMDGRRRTFPMIAEDESVLAAAERAGLQLPFSCRSGICATCRARVTGGEVVMAHNIALADWELDAGFVLCCQARPTTKTLELSYDEK